jgi:hypothetical protein
MKRLRHSLGRWLLRDDRPATVNFDFATIDPGGAEAIRKMLVRLKRERGGKDLGLS